MKHAILDQLGLPGIAGLGLLLFGLSFYLGSVVPAQNELANLKLEQAQRQTGRSPLSAGESSINAAARASASQPALSIAEFPELFRALDDLAEQHGLILDRVSYDLTEREGRTWLDIKLPVRTGYLPLRAFLRDVLAMEKAPTLEELSLKRQQPSDPVVDAAVRLSYRVAPAP